MFPIRFGKWCATAIALSVALAAPHVSRASPLKDPRRVINGQTVDLTPLFHWWTNQASERPLKAWAHVTGTVAGTNLWGWIIEAHIERATPSTGDDTDAPKDGKIVLRHPPAAEFAEFEKLAAELKDLRAQHDKLSGEATQAGKRAQDAAAKEAAGNMSVRRAARLQQQVQQSGETMKQDDDQLKTIDQQIKELKEKLSTFPSETKYSVDSFALDLKQKANGIPIFERGGASR
jgi:hypothetical protein